MECLAMSSGDITRLLGQFGEGDDRARNDLIAHACDRLRCLASKMLREDFPHLRRWEQTDDVLQNALIRLHRALAARTIESSEHFWKLAARQVRRELLDLVRHHRGPQADAANHHTDHSRAADDSGGALARQAGPGEPSSVAQWKEFLEQVQALPEEEQRVVDLLWVEGQTQEQAAAILNVSLRTVKRRWQSARLLLSRACC
jgi:RNA polymerase sigma-70 factor (ECF subfamily)